MAESVAATRDRRTLEIPRIVTMSFHGDRARELRLVVRMGLDPERGLD
jgi:hypothetical protein